MGRSEKASALGNFIERRNGPDVPGKPFLEDLKQQFPSASVNPLKGKKTVKTGTHALDDAHIARSNVPRTLHDTDASLSKTTSDSTRRGQADGEVKGDPHEPGLTSAYIEEVVDSDGPLQSDEEYVDDEDEELPSLPLHDERAMHATRSNASQAPQTKPDGRNLGRISGDTYPATTSGRPSTTNTDDHHKPQDETYPQPLIAQPTAIRERRDGRSSRLMNIPSISPQLPPGHRGDQGHAGQQQPMLRPANTEDMLRDVNAGFTYSKISTAKVQPNQLQHAQPPTSKHLSTQKTAASTFQPQQQAVHMQGPIQQNRPEPQYNVPAVFQQDGHNQTLGSAPRHATPEPPRPRRRQPPQEQQSFRQSDKAADVHTLEAPRDEIMSEVVDHHDNPRQRDGPIDAQYEVQEALQLDHPPPELYAMTFKQLRATSFDADPNAVEPGVLSAFQPGDSLPKKLNALLDMDIQSKQDYFASLGIEEWEEAGEWFLDSFAMLTERFKIARREKRKIAHDFESEIEQRHESVSKKQMLTKAALAEMRESGGKILQGTPKKGANVLS